MGEENFSSSGLVPSPNAIGCEKKLLGLILGNNSDYDRVSDFLRPEHFAHPVHRTIYEAIEDLLLRAEVTDINSVLDSMEPNESLNKIGGIEYLKSLQNNRDYIREIDDDEYNSLVNGYSEIGLSETCGRTIYHQHLRSYNRILCMALK